MSNELSRYGKNALANTDGNNVVPKVMVGAGAGTLAVSALAAFLPFIGAFPLAIILLIAGVVLWAK